MAEPTHRDVPAASPAKEGRGNERGQWHSYSSSKLVAQDTTLLRNAIAPVL